MIDANLAIKRAKDFLNNHIGDLYAHLEDFAENYPDDYTFDNPEKPYYVYVDVENYGCFSSKSFFCSKKEVENLIEDQLESDHRHHWDNVIIFDVDKNQVVKPKIVL